MATSVVYPLSNMKWGSAAASAAGLDTDLTSKISTVFVPSDVSALPPPTTGSGAHGTGGIRSWLEDPFHLLSHVVTLQNRAWPLAFGYDTTCVLGLLFLALATTALRGAPLTALVCPSHVYSLLFCSSTTPLFFPKIP